MSVQELYANYADHATAYAFWLSSDVSHENEYIDFYRNVDMIDPQEST